MKNKYDLNLVYIIYIINIIVLIIISYNIKISTYKNFSLIHLNNNKYELIVKEEDLELFQQTKLLYINNSKYKYTLLETNKDIKEINNIKYNELIIKISKYKSNDNLIECSIINKRIRLIQIFTSIYK